MQSTAGPALPALPALPLTPAFDFPPAEAPLVGLVAPPFGAPAPAGASSELPLHESNEEPSKLTETSSHPARPAFIPLRLWQTRRRHKPLRGRGAEG